MSSSARSSIDDVLRVLRTHVPVDERERASLQQFLTEVPQLSDPCNENIGLVHVTASAIVVSHAGDKVALHLHKRLGMWLQPGGHIDVGELPVDAALREAREETGLPVEHQREGGVLFHVDVHPGPKGHTHHDVRYLLRSPELPMQPAEGESPDVKWFTWDEALAIADAGLLGALRAARTHTQQA
ncbi:MAG: NUDIX hydrolase [Ilumatobacteraceae bacterium]|jgi:8-oxo-dGTP pyrophosphatase MutT (NUDIX family)|nr:NUDIX hydrolase [Ilumatobacteraceae bacterium]